MSLKDKDLNCSYTHVNSPYIKQFVELWYETENRDRIYKL